MLNQLLQLGARARVFGVVLGIVLGGNAAGGLSEAQLLSTTVLGVAYIVGDAVVDAVKVWRCREEGEDGEKPVVA